MAIAQSPQEPHRLGQVDAEDHQGAQHGRRGEAAPCPAECLVGPSLFDAHGGSRGVAGVARYGGSAKPRSCSPEPATTRLHLIVVATGDRGLAGAFNTNIVRAARRKADALIAEGKTVLSTWSAARAARCCSGFYPKAIVGQYDTSGMKAPTFADALAIAKEVTERFDDRQFDVAHLAYAISARRWLQEPVVEQIIPVAPAEAEQTKAGPFAPGRGRI